MATDRNMRAVIIAILLVLFTALGTGAQWQDIFPWAAADTAYMRYSHTTLSGDRIYIATPDTMPWPPRDVQEYLVVGDSLFRFANCQSGATYRFSGLIQPADTVIYRTLTETIETKKIWQ